MSTDGYNINDLFSRRSTGFSDMTVGFGNPFADQKPQEAPKESILQSLAPGKSFKVEASNIKSLGVDSTKGNIKANINPNQNALNSIGQECKNVKADISATIREAQGQAVEATRAVGADPERLFADTRIAPETGIELFIPAVGSKATGAGSLAMKAAGNLSSIDDVVSDRKKMSNEEAMAAIERELRSRSAPSQQDSRAGFKVSMSADASFEEEKKSGFDWNRFFDEGHKLKDLMSIDPDNPQPELVPEFSEIDQIEKNVAEATEKNDYAEEITSGVKVEGNTATLTAKDFEMAPEKLGAKVKGMSREEMEAGIYTVSAFLQSEIKGLKGLDKETTKLGNDVKLALVPKDLQPEPPPPPRPERNMAMGLGMVA